MWKKRFVRQHDLTELHDKLKEKGKRVVFTAGAWDILHVGQARYLEEAKKFGDVLVVGVSSNAAIRAVKGEGKPILDEKVRLEMLTYLRCVDLVTLIPEPSCQPTLALLKPDVFVTVKEEWNGDYKESREYKTVVKYGGEVKIVDRQSPYISTTKIIQRAVGVQLGEVFKDFMKLKDNPLKD